MSGLAQDTATIPGKVGGGPRDRHLVCVMDGSEKHCHAISGALLSFYKVATCLNLQQAIATVLAQKPAAIVLGENLPPHGGLQALRQLRKLPQLKETVIVCTTIDQSGAFADEARAAGAEDCLTKPFLRSALLNALSHHLNGKVEAGWERVEPVQREALKKTVAVFNSISDAIDSGEPIPYATVQQSCMPLVQSVRSASFRQILDGVRGHDNYSYVHSLRVATFLALFGDAIGLGDEELLLLSTGGLLHDVGKMAIPHDILNKPGRLDAAEFETMKLHVHHSVEALRSSNVPKGAQIIAAQHHEKLDGTGYPNGLKGGQLNELARMAAIIDVFGALTDRRVYKDPMPPEKALSIMVDEMRGHLDEGLLSVFRAMLLDSAAQMGA